MLRHTFVSVVQFFCPFFVAAVGCGGDGGADDGGVGRCGGGSGGGDRS